MPYIPGVSPPQPGAASFIECFGHSYMRQPVGLGTTVNSITTDQSGQMSWILASALNVAPSAFRNHAQTASVLCLPQRNQSGFARVLADIQRTRKTYPFVRSGGMYIGMWGINDIGHWGTGTNVANGYKSGLRAFISRARASATYLCTGGTPWTFGAGFTAAASTFLDFTSGGAIRATATTNANATFTFPLGYKGEPVVFAYLVSAGATGGDITVGGTVAGTSGIIGNVYTTDSGGVNSTYGLRVVRFTSAVNGLSAANAGQTITFTVTRVSASGEIILDSGWIEAFKPDPVVVCNQPRLPARTFVQSIGDVGTTASSATITSNIAAFATATDAGNSITETDAQGAFTAGKTISSVTNATTAVMSATAAATKTNVQVTLNRTLNGYVQYNGGSDNTNFAGATVASHAAADADVATLNGWITSVAAEFDSMVAVADLDSAIGADANLPSYVHTYFALIDGLHPNELGNMKCANAMFDAIETLRASDAVDLSNLELPGIPSYPSGSQRNIRRSANVYLPDFGAWGSAYTAVAGDMFAMPIMITEAAEKWGQAQVHQTNAPATSGSSVRWGVYDDTTMSGYPQNLWKEPTSGGATALGTTSGVKTLSSIGWNMEPGLYWLVLKIDSLGTTASQLNTIIGPCPYLPSWTTSGGTASPIAWKVTGVASGTLPTLFPSGASLVTTAPALGVLTT